MIVSCTAENLAKGLGIVGRSVGTRATLPVLNNILLRTEKGGIKLSATDLEMGINTWIGAKVDQDGAITVPAKLLIDYISNNSDKKIDLSLKELNLHLNSDHYKVNIRGIDAAEFPLIPKIKKGTEIIVQAKDLSRAISKTIIASALDDTRPVLSGIYFKAHANTLTMVATDSYRLSEQKINLLNPVSAEISFIVPARPLAEVLRILGGFSDKVVITPDENQVEFQLGDTMLSSRLINGSFPDYRQIIPDKSTSQITVAKTEFGAAIKMAQIFSREANGSIKLKLQTSGKICVAAVSPHLGEDTSEVNAEVSGKEFEITFSAKFILDVLQILESDNIKLDLSDEGKPAIVTGANDNNYLHIIMPIREE